MALGNGERYYSPTLARFIQQDSFTGFNERPDTLNRYSYTVNNPLKHTDPSGHIAPLVILGVLLVGAAIGAACSYAKQSAEIADGTRKEINYEDVVSSAGWGGAVAGIAFAASAVGTVAAGAVIGGGAVLSAVQV